MSAKAETTSNFLIWMAPQEIRNSTQRILPFKFPYNFCWQLIIISIRLYAAILSALSYPPYTNVSTNYLSHCPLASDDVFRELAVNFTNIKKLFNMTKECFVSFISDLGYPEMLPIQFKPKIKKYIK
jgi:hypothetical protein